MKANRIKKTVSGSVANKVPVILQLEILECGAACLAMILAYYNKWVSLEQVRSDCGVSRDGVKAKNILKAARNYGMEADGYRFSVDGLRKSGVFPCIIHWGLSHFVVCKGFKGEKVYLNDPSKGAISVSIEEFSRFYTGICLILKPGADFMPSGKKKSILDFTKNRIEGNEGAIAFISLSTFLFTLTAILLSTFSKFFLDYLVPGSDACLAVPFFVLLILLSSLQATISILQCLYQYRIRGKLGMIGNYEFFWSVLHKPMQFFSQRLAGDILTRQIVNGTIANTLIIVTSPLFLNGCMLVFYLVIMLKYSVPMTVIGLGSMLGNIWIAGIISNKRMNITRVMLRDSGKLDSSTASGIEMIETLKATGSEGGFFEKWAGYQASVNRSKVRFANINAYLGTIPLLLTRLANAIVLICGGYFVMRSEFTVGMILAFQGFLTQFMAPAEQLINAGQTIQEMRVHMERVDDVLGYPEDPIFKQEKEVHDRSETGKLSGNISIRNLTFGYSKMEAPLIRNFNLELPQGKSVAFVGSSGSGKSTLSRLISGLYEPWEGEILYDGKKISEIDRDTFTNSVTVIDQDIVLFEDTIANNIRMWDRSIEDFEIIMAARDARIHEDIMERVGGYNYIISENGRDFSGGQRQRLEIARALAQDPTLLIMDEATSALDAKTEHEVVQRIRDRGITCIVVAHRLSTIRDCDEIIVLHKGEAVERGTHEELMEKGGLYAELETNE